MTGEIKAGGYGRLVLLIRAAYWGAVLIISAVAMGSFLLVQRQLDDHQRSDSLLAMVSQQKALSQRIVFLAGAAEAVTPDQRKPLTDALDNTVSQFEQAYNLILQLTDIEAADGTVNAGHQAEAILYGAPNHLDHFVSGLIANGHRLVAALREEHSGGGSGLTPDGERVRLDETIATATLAGFTALERKISALSQAKLAELRDTHRYLFYAIIGIIILVVVFIFQPMAGAIRRRTNELVDAKNSMAMSPCMTG